MATHSSVLAWRIPGMGESGGLLSMGSHRVRHDWSNLAAAGGYRLESHSKCKIYQGTLTKSPLILIQPASLLSHFSCVRPCATPQTAAPQAPPSLGLAISFSNAWKWKVKVRSLSRIRLLAIPWTAAYQATSVHSIFQARVLPGVGCHCLLRILILLCT